MAFKRGDMSNIRASPSVEHSQIQEPRVHCGQVSGGEPAHRVFIPILVVCSSMTDTDTDASIF
jgi:hypothetical protein